ncbi:DUF6602 domain-containing protein [Burkholderia sp. 3C]
MASRLLEHLAALENSLIADSQRLKLVDNTTIMGGGRETFVREFLRGHLGASIGIGTGEIISATRPHDHIDRQWDAVIYDTRFPKLALSKDVDSFLIESVFCTIEVKSTLNEEEYLKSARAAAELNYRWKLHAKETKRPAPRRFLIAYDGPVHMKTVLGWMQEAYKSNQLQSPSLPLREMYFDGANELKRYDHVSSSLDGVFVLGRGFIAMDSFRFRFPGAVDQEPGRIGGRLFNYACAGGAGIALASMFLCLIDVVGQLALIDTYMPAIGGSLEFSTMPAPKKI